MNLPDVRTVLGEDLTGRISPAPFNLKDATAGSMRAGTSVQHLVDTAAMLTYRFDVLADRVCGGALLPHGILRISNWKA